MSRRAAALLMLALGALPAAAAETFTVAPRAVRDEKAVFATVESEKVVAARARIGGTVGAITVREGDPVAAGQPLAAVGDDKLAAQLQAFEAEAARARADLARAEDLFARGVIPKAQLDRARAAASVADNALKAQVALIREAQVLAPTDGRVLSVPVVAGSVVLPGEAIAVIAAERYVLRLRVPERHARFLKVGDPVRLADAAAPGTIRLVYPEIADGRVVADADVAGLDGFFVGERVRVVIATDPRMAIVVPARFVRTRFGVDSVLLAEAGAEPREVPVQRGRTLPLPDLPDGIEILSGLAAGDVLVAP